MEPWLRELLESTQNATVIGEYRSATSIEKEERYGNNTQSIAVTFKFNDGEQFTKPFIVKTMPHSGGYRQLLDEYRCFQAEIDVYTKILPNMEGLLKAKSSTSRPWSKYVGHHLEEAIVLEEPTDSAFRAFPGMKGLDIEHAKVALKCLGVFHGLSSSLIKEDYPLPPMRLIEDKEGMEASLQGALQHCANACSIWEPKWLEIGEKIKNEKSLVIEKLRALAVVPEGVLVVLNHGSSWTWNMMFTYHRDGSPDSAKFFDFLCPNWNTFGWDLQGIISCRVLPKIRETHRNLLLQIYQSALAKTMKGCGVREELIPTFEQVSQEFDRLKYYRFVNVVVLYLIFSAETEALDDGPNATPSTSDDLYREGLKKDIQNDIWNLHLDGTF